MAWRRILVSPAAKTFGSSSSSFAARPSAASQQSPMTPLVQSLQTLRLSTTTSQSNTTTNTKPKESLNGIAPEDRPFVHHGRRPRYHNYEKFKQPRKRASKLFAELNQEACAKAKEDTPHIWQHDIRVGDSIELKMISQGGIKPSAAAKATAAAGAEMQQEIEKIRGVVLGKVHRGLGSSLILRDVVYGLPIERRIPLYSPMIQECTVLERNFIFKGRRKVKRAKLYYFRDRNPLLTKVSKY